MLRQDHVGVQKTLLVHQLRPNASVFGARRLGRLVADGGFGFGDGKGTWLGGLRGPAQQQGAGAAASQVETQ
ncbi:hypothetical protein D3C71_2203850 [compost metagenome]